MGRHQREKGKRFERDTVNTLKAWGFEAKRLAPMQAGHADDFADVRAWNERHVLEVECSHGKKVDWRKKCRQMMSQRRDGGLGVCRLKDDNQEPVWIVPDEVMRELLR